MKKFDENDIESEVNEMLALLSKPLNKTEISNGWSVDCQSAMLKLFGEIKQRLEKSEKHPPLYIARGLDQWGVTQGDMFEKAAKICNMLRLLD
jgi:hypothetical protein